MKFVVIKNSTNILDEFMNVSKRVDLGKREERLAYKLLFPALLIIFLCALYPLGHVFYTSFTDKKFASSKEYSFVGFKNYQKLLSLSIKELPPVVDKTTGQVKIDPATKAIVYERPINVLPRKPLRYKEIEQFSLFGNRYVIGATDPDFVSAVYNTVTFTMLAVFMETVLGIIIALVVNSRFPGQGTMRAVMLIPWAVITVVSARIWEFMLLPNRIGFFNTLLFELGLANGQLSFLTMDNLQLPALIAVDVWKTTPFVALLVLAGLQLISQDLYKAADVDGAGKFRQFFSITLPLLRPVLAVALIFRTLDSLRVFDIFQVLLSSRKYSMASYNYEQLINYRNMGLASAIGVIIFMIIAFFAISYTKMLGVDSDDA